MLKRKILVTGASGYIASQLVPAFRGNYELTLLDVKETDLQGNKIPGVKIADLGAPDYEKYQEYFKGIDITVHLGYYWEPGESGENCRSGRGPSNTNESTSIWLTTCISSPTTPESVGWWWRVPTMLLTGTNT